MSACCHSMHLAAALSLSTSDERVLLFNAVSSPPLFSLPSTSVRHGLIAAAALSPTSAPTIRCGLRRYSAYSCTINECALLFMRASKLLFHPTSTRCYSTGPYRPLPRFPSRNARCYSMRPPSLLSIINKHALLFDAVSSHHAVSSHRCYQALLEPVFAIRRDFIASDIWIEPSTTTASHRALRHARATIYNVKDMRACGRKDGTCEPQQPQTSCMDLKSVEIAIGTKFKSSITRTPSSTLRRTGGV